MAGKAAPSRCSLQRRGRPPRRALRRGSRSPVIMSRREVPGPEARSCSPRRRRAGLAGSPRRPPLRPPLPQSPAAGSAPGPQSLAGSAPGPGVLPPSFGHLCDLPIHAALCRPRRPPKNAHLPGPTSPGPGRSSSPLTFPLVGSDFYASARGRPSKEGADLHPASPAPDHKSPFLPAAGSPGRAAATDARGRGSSRPGEPLGAGRQLPALNPHHLPGPLRHGLWAYSGRGPKRNVGATASAGLAGRGGQGRSPDLAAGRRGPLPLPLTRRPQPSGLFLHFAPKIAKCVCVRGRLGAKRGVRTTKGNGVPRSLVQGNGARKDGAESKSRRDRREDGQPRGLVCL